MGLKRIGTRIAAPTLAAWVLFASYLLAARLPRNFFPFSIFDMYSGEPGDVASRYLFLDESGRGVRLSTVEALECEAGRPDLAELGRTCGERFHPIAYVVRDQQQLVDARLGTVADGEPLRVVGRTYSLSAGGRPPDDCEVARCRMRRP